jgi:hypothetical protein
LTARDAGNGGDRRSFLAASAVMIAVVLLAFALSGIKGPASRCEGAGGQMLVGPGGETACFDGRTFLPIEGFEEALTRAR